MRALHTLADEGEGIKEAMRPLAPTLAQWLAEKEPTEAVLGVVASACKDTKTALELRDERVPRRAIALLQARYMDNAQVRDRLMSHGDLTAAIAAAAAMARASKPEHGKVIVAQVTKNTAAVPATVLRPCHSRLRPARVHALPITAPAGSAKKSGAKMSIGSCM